MLDHVFHTNIIAYCQQNVYLRFTIYTDLFTLREATTKHFQKNINISPAV